MPDELLSVGYHEDMIRICGLRGTIGKKVKQGSGKHRPKCKSITQPLQPVKLVEIYSSISRSKQYFRKPKTKFALSDFYTLNKNTGSSLQSTHQGGSRNGVPIDQPPLVTVITVCYNAAKTLEQTLLSVKSQRYQNFEFIVVDGASTDETLDILRAHDTDIDRWISEPDGGIYDAMNKGAALARGEFLAFLNADDRYLLDTLYYLAKAAKGHSAAVFHGNMVKERVIDGAVYHREEKPNPNFMPRGMGIFHPTCFVKRAEFGAVGGYNTRYRLAADYDLFLRLWQKGLVFHHIDKALAVFSLGGVSNAGCGTYSEAVEIQRLNKTGTSKKTMILLWKCRMKNAARRIVFAAARLTGQEERLNKKISGRWR